MHSLLNRSAHHRSLLFSAVIVGLGALLSSPSEANDSSARLDSGGIRLVPNYSISLKREDLYISRERISIRYEFFNKTDSDVSMLVAFPVPEIDGDIEANYVLDAKDPINFLDFSILSDGRPVNPQVELKYLVNGIDFTDAILAEGIPASVFDPRYYDAVEKLPLASRQRLAAKGALNWHEGQDFHAPNWTMKAVLYWSQVFPAGKRVVLEHSYRPVAGGGFYNMDYGIPENIDRFCMDDGFLKAAEHKAATSRYKMLLGHDVRYILKTANSWLGPIGDFRLVLDKLDPNNLISLCADNVRKIGPTQFEIRAQNFTPTQDLDILFLEGTDE